MNMKRFLPIMMLLAMLFVASPAYAQDSVTQAQEPVATAVSADSSHSGWVMWLVDLYKNHMNYWTTGAFMAIESSFIPFPSEVVVPPAVFFSLEEKNEIDMVWWIIILVGTLGALIGAYINYFLSMWLGRPIIYKFANSKVGHLLRLSQMKVERAELGGRFIPVVRQLISIPAGLSRMNLGSFTLITTIGAFIWNCILALLGYLAHQVGNEDMIKEYSDEISIVIIALLAVVILFFVIRYFIKKR